MVDYSIYQYYLKQMIEFLTESLNKVASYNRNCFSLDLEYSNFTNVIDQIDNANICSNAHLLMRIYNEYGFHCEKNNDKEVSSFYMISDDKKILYILSSIGLISEMDLSGYDEIVVVYFQKRYDDLDLWIITSSNDKYKKNINYQSIFEIYEKLGEIENFNSFLFDYKAAAEKILFLRTIKVPKGQAKDEMKKRLLSELKTFGYNELLSENKIDEKAFGVLRQNFTKNVEILLGDNPFSESLFSAEFQYTLIEFVGDIEKTSCIAGYLKSIEEFSVLFLKSMKDKGITISGKKVKNRYIEIKEENYDAISWEMGSVIACISYNRNKLFNQEIDNSVIDFIKCELDEYREHSRNGFFHTDNIIDIESVSLIRKRTFFIYFYLLGALRIEESFISDLNPYKKDHELDYKSFNKWLDDSLKEVLLIHNQYKGLKSIIFNYDNDYIYICLNYSNKKNIKETAYKIGMNYIFVNGENNGPLILNKLEKMVIEYLKNGVYSRDLTQYRIYVSAFNHSKMIK